MEELDKAMAEVRRLDAIRAAQDPTGPSRALATLRLADLALRLVDAIEETDDTGQRLVDALTAEAIEHEKRAAEEMACTYPYEYVVKYHLARARFCRSAAKGNP